MDRARLILSSNCNRHTHELLQPALRAPPPCHCHQWSACVPPSLTLSTLSCISRRSSSSVASHTLLIRQQMRPPKACSTVPACEQQHSRRLCATLPGWLLLFGGSRQGVLTYCSEAVCTGGGVQLAVQLLDAHLWHHCLQG